MRLSAEIFEQVLRRLRSDGQNEKDKRLQPRVGITGETLVVSTTPEGKRVTGRVRVRDLSAAGIGLFHSEKLKKGQVLIIKLDSETGESAWLVCIVAYCRKVEDHRYSVGAHIKQMLRADEVSKMTAEVKADSKEAT